MARSFSIFYYVRNIFLDATLERPNIVRMLEEDASENLGVDEAQDMGAQRFASMSLFDAPIFLRPDPLWAADIKHTAQQQLQAVNVEALLCAYIELLHKTKALVDFWDTNVGPTVEWPLSVMGDSEEAEAHLHRRIDKLRVAVAFVEDTTHS